LDSPRVSVFSLNLSGDMRAFIKEQAEHNGRTMTAEIIARLEASREETEREDVSKRLHALEAEMESFAANQEILLDRLAALERSLQSAKKAT